MEEKKKQEPVTLNVEDIFSSSSGIQFMEVDPTNHTEMKKENNEVK